MKNYFLVSSALVTIAMIVFIQLGTKRINQSQEDAFEPANEWFNEISEKHENMMAAEEAKAAARVRFAERMRNLSYLQESITVELTNAFKAKPQNPPGREAIQAAPNEIDPDGAALLESLARRQAQIANEFERVRSDLGDHLRGTTEHPHLQTLSHIRKSGALARLQDIKAKLRKNHAYQAAEMSKTWADQMMTWSKELEPVDTDS